MTNIFAFILFTVTTNWVTTSITSPVSQGYATTAEVKYDIANQTGARVTNTTAVIVWEGQDKAWHTNQFVLESTKPFYDGTINRSRPIGMPERMADYWNKLSPQ